MSTDTATAARIASDLTAAGFPAHVTTRTRRPIVVVSITFERSIDMCVALRPMAGVGTVEPSGAEDGRYRVHLAA